jgi:hypothetical protein
MYIGGQEQAKLRSKMGLKALEELLGAIHTSWSIRGHVRACLARLFRLRPRPIYVLSPSVPHTFLSRKSWRIYICQSSVLSQSFFLSPDSRGGNPLGVTSPFSLPK